MIVTQPDRLLLRKQVKAFAHELIGTILDVGSADGKRYGNLFSHATEHLTLDISAECHPDIMGSAEDIPLDDTSVDSVLCTQVLEHVPHPQKAISEMFRVLKSGGKAFITVPQWNELHEEPHDYFRYTCFGLKTMCEDAGFSVLKIDQRGKYHACRAQMKIRYWIDRLKPYERKWAMLIMAPLSTLCTKYALFRDNMNRSTASTKHAIGWAVLLQKS